MNLKLSDLASIAELIGATAIVVSLLYVGIQVNDNAQAVRSATANETSAAISSWYAQIGSSPQATQVFLDGITNPAVLSREETAQYIYLLHGLMLQYQTAYYLAQEQTLDAELQESITNTLSGVREMAGFHMYWGQRRDLFQLSFREWVDDLLVGGDTNTNLEELYRMRRSE
jgi:hypothetical protein